MHTEHHILSAISKVTGHELSDLDKDMYLDTDLGMDSIKIVELLNQLQNTLPESLHEDFNAKIASGELLTLRTVGELLESIGSTDSIDAPDTDSIQQESTNTSPAPDKSIEDKTDHADILHAQYPFLVSHWASSYCALVSQIRLQGELQPAVANQAWQMLLDRHPVLRCYFTIPPQASNFKQYQLEILQQASAPEIEVTDLQHLDKKEQEHLLNEQIHHYQNFEWPLQQWPLHRFILYRLGEQQFELLFCNHHLISDGLSNQQVMREFMVLYQALESGQKPRLPPAVSVSDYLQLVQSVNNWHDPVLEKQLNDFLKAQGRESFFWDPQKKGKPKQHFADSHSYFFSLDKATSDILLKATGDWRLPMNTLLLGAYLRTVARFDDTAKSIIVNIPTSGRVYPGVDASDVIGCFAQNLALSFSPALANGPWKEQLTAINQVIQQGIAAGYDRSQTRLTALAIQKMVLEEGKVAEPAASLVRATLKSNVYMPYIGHTRIERQYGSIQVLDYHANTGTNTGTLDTIIEVFAGQLNITANYDANYFNKTFIKNFAAAFKRHLKELAKQVIPADTIDAMPAGKSADKPTVHFNEQLVKITSEVIFRQLATADLAKDLEADLGLDSLERIRIVNRLRHLANHDIDPGQLLECRTLQEMAAGLAAGSSDLEQPELQAPRLTPESENVTQAPWAKEAIPYLQIIEQSRLTPDATAVLTDNGASLNYRDLNARSNQLAHYLRSQNIGAGSLVGLMLHRNEHLLIAILGIVKAGGAYVPLDPNYPVKRLSYMLNHAKIPILLSEQALHEQINQLVTPGTPLQTIILLDQEKPRNSYPVAHVYGNEFLKSFPENEPDLINSPDDLMVVLYTSGSTGVPKGVASAHRGYMNRFKWHQKLFDIKPFERVAQKTSICFDISVWELFWPLMLGACVCPVSAQRVKNPWKLAQWMEDYQINIMHFVPSLYGEFISSVDFEKHRFPALRWLIFSGEALPVSFIRQWMDHFGTKIGLANLYGPTEASIDVTAYLIKSRPESERIPIGYAVDQVHLRVLDDKMKPLAPGNMGELWIGGIQLAHGYLHDPKRTAESFFPNPFPDEIPGKHLYRTGDLVVEMEDGCIDYRGRIDSQLKIRGFRVELGEIEAALMARDDIKEAAVLAMDHGDGQIRLWAWLAGEKTEDNTLRKALSGRLPEYMIPHRFSWLASLPKNPNGKLDRNQLKQWSKSDETVQPPGSVALQGGIDEDKKEDKKTLAASQKLSDAAPRKYPLGPAQKWLIQFFDSPYQWAGFSRFRYLRPLDIELFKKALAAIVKRHPALRAGFRLDSGEWVQSFFDADAVDTNPEIAAPVDFFDGKQLPENVRQEKIKQLITETSRALRIDKPPLWRVFIMAESDTCYSIVTIGHHMINDLLGSDVLFKETWQAYEQLSKGEKINLGAQVPSYKDFLDSLSLLGESGQASALGFWKSKFPSREYHFSIPIDHRLGANIEAAEASETLSLTKARTLMLQKLKQSHDCSLYMLLLAPLYLLMSEWSRQSWVVLSHRMHGRDLGPGNQDTQAFKQHYFSSVGNFAVNYPVGISIDSSDWADIIRHLKAFFAEIPLNGISFDWVGEHLPSYCYPDNNLTPVRVNFLGNRSFPPSSVFEFSAAEVGQRYALPEQARISLIEVIFTIVDDQVRIEWSYSKNFHKAATIQALSTRYLELMQFLLEGQLPAPAIEQPSVTQFSEWQKPLFGKTAIVTGASRGIGRHIALKLAEQGARVVLAARSKNGLDSTYNEIRQNGGEALVMATDICELDQVEAMVRQVKRWSGRIDILVNNAGLTGLASLRESDPRQWKHIIEVNLFGAYYCCRSVLPAMTEQNSGKIVNIGSDSSHIGYPLFSAYAAAKHGLLGLSKSLAEEVKNHNIQVNTVCPSAVGNQGGDHHPVRSGVTADNVADTVLFLVTKDADSITGQHINIFGQQDMYWFGSEKMTALQKMFG